MDLMQYSNLEVYGAVLSCVVSMCRVGVVRKGRFVNSSLQHGQIRGFLNIPLPSWPSSDG